MTAVKLVGWNKSDQPVSRAVAGHTCLLNVTGCQPTTRLRKGTSVKVREVRMVAK